MFNFMCHVVEFNRPLKLISFSNSVQRPINKLKNWVSKQKSRENNTKVHENSECVDIAVQSHCLGSLVPGSEFCSRCTTACGGRKNKVRFEYEIVYWKLELGNDDGRFEIALRAIRSGIRRNRHHRSPKRSFTWFWFCHYGQRRRSRQSVGRMQRQ